jgi:hypothetical protein
MEFYVTATTMNRAGFTAKVDRSTRTIGLHSGIAYGPYISVDEEGAKHLIELLQASLKELPPLDAVVDVRV